jgi:hypothetical protein
MGSKSWRTPSEAKPEKRPPSWVTSPHGEGDTRACTCTHTHTHTHTPLIQTYTCTHTIPPPHIHTYLCTQIRLYCAIHAHSSDPSGQAGRGSSPPPPATWRPCRQTRLEVHGRQLLAASMAAWLDRWRCFGISIRAVASRSIMSIRAAATTPRAPHGATSTMARCGCTKPPSLWIHCRSFASTWWTDLEERSGGVPNERWSILYSSVSTSHEQC